MKKIILVTALFTCSVSFAQKNNVIKANLFSPLAKSGSFFYERSINEKTSVQLGLGFTAFSDASLNTNGIFITPEYRFYLSQKPVLNGFYVGPFLRYQDLKFKDKSSDGVMKLVTFGGGMVVGHQWMIKDLISLDLFAGPQYNTGKIVVESGNQREVPAVFNGFTPRFGFTLGVAF